MYDACPIPDDSPPCKTLQGGHGFPYLCLFWYNLIREGDKQILIRKKETEQQTNKQTNKPLGVWLYFFSHVPPAGFCYVSGTEGGAHEKV